MLQIENDEISRKLNLLMMDSEKNRKLNEQLQNNLDKMRKNLIN